MTGNSPSSSTYVRALREHTDETTVLCVAADGATAGALAEGLRTTADGIRTYEATSVSAAFDRLDAEDVGCVVSELAFPSTDGVAFLREVRSRFDDLPFVLVTDAGSEGRAADAVNAGVDGYVTYDGVPGEAACRTLAERIEPVVADYRSHQRFETATELLFQLTEDTTDVLWMFTADWSETVVVNDSYETVWNQSMAEVVADPSKFLEAVHPDDIERVRDAMAILSNGDPADVEFRLRTGDGERWVDARAEPVFDADGSVAYVAGFTRDVTERHRRRQRERESSEQLETIVENLPVVVFTIDRDGTFTTAAGAGLDALDLQPGDLRGASVYEVYGDHESMVDAVDRALAGEEVQVTLQVDGLTFETWYRPIEDDRGRVTEVVGISRDVTRMKQREERIEQVTEATRRLPQARSEEEVGHIVVDIIDSMIGCPITAYWSSVEGARRLDPLVASDSALAVAGVTAPAELAPFTEGTDELALFEAGESHVVEDYSDLENPSSQTAELGTLLVVPVGDHGMVNVGRRETGQFDEFDRHLVELLCQTATDALDRVERERTLRERRNTMETLLNNAPLGLYALDPGGTVVDARGRGLAGLDLEPDEVVGESIFDVYADVPDVVAIARRALDGEAVSETVAVGDRWFDNTFVPLRDETGELERVVGVAFDVTAQREAQAQFAALSESAVALANSDTPDEAVREAVETAATVFEDQVVAYWDHDEAADRLVAAELVDRTDLPGKGNSKELTHERGDPVWRVFEGGETVLENDFDPDDTANDTPFQSMLFAPVADDGLVTIGAAEADAFDDRDRYLVSTLAETAATTLDRLRYEADIEANRRELERSNESLRQFAYVASHDLQEPLRMVSSYVSLLEEEYGDRLDGDAEMYMDYAVDGATRMQELIDALLQYSRVHTQGGAFEAVDTNEVFDRTVKSLELLVEEEDATVTRGDLPRVKADLDQLGQVFQNLVKNAVQHGGGAPTVEVAGEREDDRVHLTVADDGPGIEPSQQDRIFDIFTQNSDRTDSTGIGLAMCRRIVERHDGELWVESEPGDGATFHVTLPAETDDEDQHAPVPRPAADSTDRT